MDFRVLGPIDVSEAGSVVDVGGSKPRALLAMLLLNRGGTLSRARLIEGLWDNDPPASAAKLIQVNISNLRKAIGADRIRTDGDGYALDVMPEDWSDIAAFESLVRDVQDEDPATTADRLRAALAIWRGTALSGLDEPFAELERGRLEELRLDAIEDRIEAELEIGRSGLVLELEELTAANPTRERLIGQRMIALYRAGRQSEALDIYTQFRRRIDSEIGIQPSAELREIELMILNHDRRLSPQRSSGESELPTPQPVVPGETRYVLNDGASIAYRVFGDGPLELVLITGWVLPMELFWDHPESARFMDRLGSFARVLVWDKRGTGLSDRVARGELPTVEQRMSDLLAVIGACGFGRPAIFGISEGTALAALMAATHPEKVSSLAIYGGWANLISDPQNPAGVPRADFDAFVTRVGQDWGNAERLLRLWAPSAADDPRIANWWGRSLRLGASPTAAEIWLEMAGAVDVRPALSEVRVPTIVIHRKDDRIISVQHGRSVAEMIPGAEYVEVPGEDHLWWVGDQDSILDPLEQHLAGSNTPAVPSRILTTVMFTDIVGSTRINSEIGDSRWRELLSEHDQLIRDSLERFDGREVKTLGDGFLAAFDAPSRAIACARSIRAGADRLGLSIRTGIHSGECEIHRDDLTGVAVVIGSRLGDLAEEGEILVSNTAAALTTDASIDFVSRGTRVLKGVDGELEVFSVQ